MERVTALLVAWGLAGDLKLARRLCRLAKEAGAAAVFLAGDVMSPNIVKLLAEQCGRVYGFSGLMDSELVVIALKKAGGYAESRAFEEAGVRVAALGRSPDPGRLLSQRGADVLITYFHPLRASLCDRPGHSHEAVDLVLGALQPSWVILAGGRSPIKGSRAVCLGSFAERREAALVERTAEGISVVVVSGA